jgi:hypothetical protein
MATAALETEPKGNIASLSAHSDAEAELQDVLNQINEAGGRVAASLDRMHGLMQDIVGDLRTARGADLSGNRAT